jgi:osmotically-inducible protein OsmY
VSAQPSEEPEKYLVQRVRDALIGDPRVGELHIDVTIRGDRVFLTGTVPSTERRDVIGELVREVLPDHTVHNHVAVEGIPGPPGSPDVESLE